MYLIKVEKDGEASDKEVRELITELKERESFRARRSHPSKTIQEEEKDPSLEDAAIFRTRSNVKSIPLNRVINGVLEF